MSALARLLPTNQYAVMAAAVALASYVQLLCEPPILGYERLGSPDRSRDSRRTGARSSAYSLLSLLAIIVPVACTVWGVATGQFWLSFAIGLWAMSLVQLRWASVQYLNWHEQQSFGTLVPVNSAARTLAVVSATFLFRNATWTLAIGAVASIAVTALLSPKRPPIAFERDGIRPLLRLGLPIAVVSAAVTSLSAWPMLVAKRLLDVQDFASYAAQSGLAAAAFGSTVGFVTVFGFPQAKRAWDAGDLELARKVVIRFFGYMAGLGWFLILMFWILGDWITAILLGDMYSGNLIPVATIAVACLFGVAGFFGWLLRLQFRQNVLAVVTVSTALGQVPIVLLFTSRMGVSGLLLSIGFVATSQALVTMAIVRDRRAAFAVVFVAATSAVVVGAAATIGT